MSTVGIIQNGEILGNKINASKIRRKIYQEIEEEPKTLMSDEDLQRQALLKAMTEDVSSEKIKKILSPASLRLLAIKGIDIDKTTPDNIMKAMQKEIQEKRGFPVQIEEEPEEPEVKIRELKEPEVKIRELEEPENVLIQLPEIKTEPLVQAEIKAPETTQFDYIFKEYEEIVKQPEKLIKKGKISFEAGNELQTKLMETFDEKVQNTPWKQLKAQLNSMIKNATKKKPRIREAKTTEEIEKLEEKYPLEQPIKIGEEEAREKFRKIAREKMKEYTNVGRDARKIANVIDYYYSSGLIPESTAQVLGELIRMKIAVDYPRKPWKQVKEEIRQEIQKSVRNVLPEEEEKLFFVEAFGRKRNLGKGFYNPTKKRNEKNLTTKRNMLRVELLDKINKKNFNSNKKEVGRALYYMVKNGTLEMENADKFIRRFTDYPERIPFIKKLYEVKIK